MRALKLSPEQIHSGSLILVNRDYGYREPSCAISGCPGTDALSSLDGRFTEYADSVCPDTKNGTSPVFLRRRAAVLFTGLMDEINGWSGIVPVSGYRTLTEQTDIWETSLAKHGEAFTKAYVAVPGHSEHQTGLAIDLGFKKSQIDFLCPDFPDSGICHTFRERAAEYGFISRYPAGKERITGIGHEPWHFRYVGTPHGEIMKKEGFTLEEYILFLRNFPYGKKSYLFTKGGRQTAVSWLEAKKGDITWLSVSSSLPYSISGNNIDGFIITEWRDQYV